jgi:TRAP-type C4-dicarboxylate transport system permease small subunit
MGRVIAIAEKIALISGRVTGWLVPIMMLLIVFEVFMRYIVHRPPMVADEFSAYMLVALAYLGMAYTWRQGGHVRINILVMRFPPRAAFWTHLFSLLVATGFTYMLVHISYQMVAYSFERGLKSSTWILTPLVWPQLTVFIGFVLLFLVVAVDLLAAISKIRHMTAPGGPLNDG